MWPRIAIVASNAQPSFGRFSAQLNMHSKIEGIELTSDAVAEKKVGRKVRSSGKEIVMASKGLTIP